MRRILCALIVLLSATAASAQQRFAPPKVTTLTGLNGNQGDIVNLVGTGDYLCSASTCTSASDWKIISSGAASGAPASPTTSVQFNTSGAFGGSANLEWITATFNTLPANSLQLGSGGANVLIGNTAATIAEDFYQGGSLLVGGNTYACINGCPPVQFEQTFTDTSDHQGLESSFKFIPTNNRVNEALAHEFVNTVDGDGASSSTALYLQDNIWVSPRQTVTSITRSGGTATVTQTFHQYVTGDSVLIAGAAQTDYNGTFTITKTGANSYTYAVSNTPATPATGTIRATGLTSMNVFSAYLGSHIDAPVKNGYSLYIGDVNSDAVVGAAASRQFTAIYSNDQTLSTPNCYQLWFDSPGVYRIKCDGVMAYYNPGFATKYTPGGVDYERTVQQFTANVAEYGTEAGGTGTQRKLRLLGANVEIKSTLTPAVTNTSANSCGTTAASIAGNDNVFKVTVGATSGTSCTVTFATAFANAPSCTVSNETTANLARSTSTISAVVLAGVFVAGDVLAGSCLGR